MEVPSQGTKQREREFLPVRQQPAAVLRGAEDIMET